MSRHPVVAADFTAAVATALWKLDLEHPRVRLTLRARLYRRVFGVWPAAVAAERYARAKHYRHLLDVEIARQREIGRLGRG